MYRLSVIWFAIFVSGCTNHASRTGSKDSTTINTTTGNVSDGGPNNGKGDTNSYDRMNDKVKDTSLKR
jgi:hypothetical protein